MNVKGMTRRTLAGAAGGLGAALLAACGPAIGTSQEASKKDRAPVKLTTNIQSPASATWPAYEAADRAIRETYPWLTMEYLGGASASFTAMAKMVVDAAGGSLPDMVYAQGTQIQYYINNKIVVSMAPYLNRDKAFDLSDFPKVALDMYSRAGQLYAIPYDHGPNMLWYNADLFRRSGVKPPDDKWTWDDVVDAARRLTVEAQGQWGILDGGPNAGWAMDSYIAPWGGRFVDETETRTQIASQGAIQAVQYWMDLFHKHKVNPLPGTFQGTADDLYLQGKVAMRVGGPWTYRGWIAKNISFESPIANWPIGPTGKRISSSMGSGYPITATSKHRDETWLYEAELLGKDPNRSLLHQFVKTGLGTPVRFSTMKEYEKSKAAMPNVQIVAPSERYSIIGRPISPAKPELDKIWSEERAKLLKQEIPVKEAAETAARRMQPFLEQNKGWDAQK